MKKGGGEQWVLGRQMFNLGKGQMLYQVQLNNEHFLSAYVLTKCAKLRKKVNE